MSERKVTETHKYVIKYYRECTEAISRARAHARKGAKEDPRGRIVLPDAKERKKKKRTRAGLR